MSVVTFYIIFLTVYSVTSEVIKKDILDIPRKTKTVGVNAIRDVGIDKNTIISSNLKLEKKGQTRNELNKKAEENRAPDWSYSSFPPETEIHVEQFKRNMTECLKEVQANDKRPVKRLSPKYESPVHGECVIACVLKRNGVIHNGKIHKDKLLSLVNKFYAKDLKMMKKLEKHLDSCIEMSANTRDECKLAAQLNECTNDLMANNKHTITVNY